MTPGKTPMTNPRSLLCPMIVVVLAGSAFEPWPEVQTARPARTAPAQRVAPAARPNPTRGWSIFLYYLGSKQIGQELLRARRSGGQRRIEMRATLNQPEHLTVRGHLRLRPTFQPIRLKYNVSSLSRDCRYDLLLRKGIFYLVYTQGAQQKIVSAEQAPTVQVMSIPSMAGSLQFVCHLAKEAPVTLYDFPGIRFQLSARAPWRPKGLPFCKLTRVTIEKTSAFICDGTRLVAFDAPRFGVSIVNKAYLAVRKYLSAYKTKPTGQFPFPFVCNRIRTN